MQNAVPKTFRTPFLKSSKTKTKTKYLKLTLSAYLTNAFSWLLKMGRLINQSSSK